MATRRPLYSEVIEQMTRDAGRTGVIPKGSPSVYIKRLEDVLQEYQRGEFLSDERILEICPDLADTVNGVVTISGVLQKWFLSKRGIDIERRNNKGYYLLTDKEQARKPTRHVKKAMRQLGLGHRKALAVDPLVLDKEDQDHLGFTVRLTAVQMQSAADALYQLNQRWQLGGNVERKQLGEQQAEPAQRVNPFARGKGDRG